MSEEDEVLDQHDFVQIGATHREARSATPPREAYEALFRIATRLHSEDGDLDTVLELIVDQAAELLGTDLAWLALVEQDRPRLATAVIHGFRDLAFLDLDLALGKGVGGVAVSEHRAIVIGDYRSEAHDSPMRVRQAAEAEGIFSLICAPMFKDDVMVGALYVANREKTDFTDVDASLLSALAAQASVAIQNRRLYHQLSDQNDLLEHAFLIHRELTQASLEGVGLSGIGDVLARLIGHQIVIEQTVCAPSIVQCPPAGSAGDALTPSITRAIVADGRHLGSVEVLGARELSPLQLKALEHGITVLALELVKRRVELEVEWRLSGELLDELLERSHPISEALAQRARRLGVDIAAPHRVLALALYGDHATAHGNLLTIARETIRRRGQQSSGRSLSARRGDEVLLALGSALEAEAVAIAREVQEAARIQEHVVRVGIGPLRHDLRESFRSAVACLALAANDTGAPGAIVEFDLLGPLRFLLDAPDMRHASAMIRETLQPVHAHDAASRSPLLPTLRAFVECDGHYAHTAQRLYIAVSTLKYRLHKLHDLLGRSPSNPDLRFQLRLAFNLLDVVDARSLDEKSDTPPGRRPHTQD
jgi:sugar diacid utilization regulator/putative methionine-R-sulfoxide reductase with GAF domain